MGELHQGTLKGVTCSLGHILQAAEYSGEFGRRRSGCSGYLVGGNVIRSDLELRQNPRHLTTCLKGSFVHPTLSSRIWANGELGLCQSYLY